VNSPAGTPTGFVTFLDGNTVLGLAVVNAFGQAFLTASPGVGNHVLTASFASFDGSFTGSTSTASSVTVNRAATLVALGTSANPAVTGQAVTFTATVRDPTGAGTPTGTVTFFVGNTALATVPLDAGGKAALLHFFFVTGPLTIQAVYSGDSNFAASSQLLTEQVN
jgi:hypothetical protein